MPKVGSKKSLRVRRHKRIRAKISGTETRPRLAVFRSQERIYAQVINDNTGITIVSASDKEVKAKGMTKTQRAEKVGVLIAEKAKAKGIKAVVFDRGGVSYSGRVRTLSEAARKNGLIF